MKNVSIQRMYIFCLLIHSAFASLFFGPLGCMLSSQISYTKESPVETHPLQAHFFQKEDFDRNCGSQHKTVA